MVLGIQLAFGQCAADVKDYEAHPGKISQSRHSGMSESKLMIGYLRSRPVAYYKPSGYAEGLTDNSACKNRIGLVRISFKTIFSNFIDEMLFEDSKGVKS